ncbi:MAG: helicase C-terminal domain-containing protein [Spirochaetales bacterium]
MLFVGLVNSEGFCRQVKAVARGDQNSVPALAPHMEAGDVVLHNHPSGNLQPSQPDLAVASGLGQQGIGFWIINNDVTECYAVCEPVVVQELSLVSVPAVASHLSSGGSFSRTLRNFESRESQVALSQLFARGFNEDSVVVAEAGTGVGKSFAYLVPALLWASRNKERVVVSTATINLQQQLFEKDIPLVQKSLGTQVKAVLVKGRRNYLCPTRLAEEIREVALDNNLPATQLNAIAEWSAQTRTGDVSELGFVPDEGQWSRVCSDADVCSGLRCAQGDGCFLARSRKEAAGAGLLVANHHLLFADLALRMNGFGTEATAVLPPFQRIIFDEAHHIEKSATSYFSSTLNKVFLFKQLGRLFRRRRGRATGLVLTLQGLGTENIEFSAFPEFIETIHNQFDLWTTEALVVLDGQGSLRIAGEAGDRLLDRLLPRLKDLQNPLVQLGALCLRLSEVWDDETEVPSEAREVRSIARRLEGLSQIIDRVTKYASDTGNVYWLERVRDPAGTAQVDLTISPLAIDQLMVKAVFDPYPTVMFTSATLTVKGDFQFWASRVGVDLVDRDRKLTGIFPSPFDYAHRVLLACPTDFPMPDQSDYQPRLESYLPELLRAARGSALVLFTSFESMRSAWQKVQPILAKENISVYRQGDEERTRLLDRFKTEITSVLFATDSFWEGVDSPGDTLRLVVLCRLPFRVPSEPVLAARMELLQSRGLDPFMNYSLPEAVTRFKQGFGRLIRHTEDSGCVVVLDPRMVRKAYGASFTASVPETLRALEPAERLLETIPAFLTSV